MSYLDNKKKKEENAKSKETMRNLMKKPIIPRRTLVQRMMSRKT